MKSAYCIAITACLTVIWLYEEKKKRGMAGNLCWKAAVGYLITRFVFFAISNQEVHGFLEVMAMDLVTAWLLYILSGNYIFSRDKFEFKHGRAAENRVVYIKIRVLGRRRYKRYVAVFYVFEQRLLLLFIKILDLVEIEQNAVWRDKCVELRDNIFYICRRSGRAV